MRFQQLLDPLPIVGVFVAFVVVALIAAECGYRLGHWSQSRTSDEKQGTTAMVTGSLLALMGFLLAVTMGMATDRFDKRRGLVLEEANSVGTMYLRAGYLPEPASSQIRDLLREYVPLRIADTAGVADARVRTARSGVIHAKLWSITEKLARTTPESDVLALFIVSLNETIDLHETRVTAGVYSRVPETVVFLLLLGSIMAVGLVGYNMGLSLRRNSLPGVVLIVLLGAIITLVIDLDRPRDGFVKVGQQPLIDLQEQIGAYPPANPPK
ncbi:MAG: hypothetical protein ACKVP2_03470 [Burkholderiales bacterium]